MVKLMGVSVNLHGGVDGWGRYIIKKRLYQKKYMVINSIDTLSLISEVILACGVRWYIDI